MVDSASPAIVSDHLRSSVFHMGEIQNVEYFFPISDVLVIPFEVYKSGNEGYFYYKLYTYYIH